MKSYYLKRAFAIAAAGIVTAVGVMPTIVVAQTTNLVDWQGSYIGDRAAVSTTRESSRIVINESDHKGWLFAQNNTTPISPYSQNYGGTSATFYGGVQMITANLAAASNPQLRVISDASWNGRNRIFVQSMGGQAASGDNPTKPSDTRGFFYWKKEDFLSNPAGSGNLALSDLDSFYLNIPGGRVNSASIRFVVQSGGTWYLSAAELSVGSKNGEVGSLSLDNLSSSQWGEWVVQDSSSSLINSAPALFDVNGLMLNNITAVGFYFEASYIYSNSVNLAFDQFTVRGPAVPEPSSVALFGGVAILAFVLCARRRK